MKKFITLLLLTLVVASPILARGGHGGGHGGHRGGGHHGGGHGGHMADAAGIIAVVAGMVMVDGVIVAGAGIATDIGDGTMALGDGFMQILSSTGIHSLMTTAMHCNVKSPDSNMNLIAQVIQT